MTKDRDAPAPPLTPHPSPLKVNLSKIPTRAPKDIDKEAGKAELEKIQAELDLLQSRFAADGRHAVLVVLQGLDASGKDGLIRRAFTGMSPLGVTVKAFKVPNTEEAAHDYLWRVHKATPERGMIQIFNRSHYEDILVPRVNKWIDEAEIKRRYRAINDFEHMLQGNGTHILKCYLHVSEEVQRERIQERLTDPTKAWKYNPGDTKVVEQRAQYLAAFEDIFKNCNDVPWHIIPSDQNWYKAFMGARLLRDLLKSLPLEYPKAKLT